MAKDAVQRAAEAHTELNIFAAIVQILEGGSLYTSRSHDAASKIIRTCKREQARLLSVYDDAASTARESSP